MKHTALIASVIILPAVVAISLIGSTATASPPAMGGPATLPRIAAVRAQVYDNPNATPEVGTTCTVINISARSPVTLGIVTVLGPGGRADAMAQINAHAGTVIEPLGVYEFVIDTSVPGVVAQTSIGGYGVRSITVEWDGNSFGVQLSSEFTLNPDVANLWTPAIFHGYGLTL
jgi:hypothetical protein